MEGRWTQHARSAPTSNIYVTCGDGRDAYGPIDFFQRGDLVATGLLPIPQLAIEPGLVWRELECEPRGTYTMPAAGLCTTKLTFGAPLHLSMARPVLVANRQCLAVHAFVRSMELWSGQDLSCVDLPAIALRLKFFVDVLQRDPSTGHTVTNASISPETSTIRACRSVRDTAF